MASNHVVVGSSPTTSDPSLMFCCFVLLAPGDTFRIDGRGGKLCSGARVGAGRQSRMYTPLPFWFTVTGDVYRHASSTQTQLVGKLAGAGAQSDSRAEGMGDGEAKVHDDSKPVADGRTAVAAPAGAAQDGPGSGSTQERVWTPLPFWFNVTGDAYSGNTRQRPFSKE